MTIDIDSLDDFTIGFLECALWSSTDESDEFGGNPLDDTCDLYDFSGAALVELVSDCELFQEDNETDLDGIDPSQAGHDFWLTRNGHGAGFWDRGLGERGERLSKASKVYGSVYLTVGDDGKVYA